MIKTFIVMIILILSAGCVSMKSENDIAIRGLLSNSYWFNTTNNCRVVDDHRVDNAEFEWSGTCINGFISGCGTLKMTDSGNNKKWVNGCFLEGKRNGKITVRGSLLPDHISTEIYKMGVLEDYQANMSASQAKELAEKRKEADALKMQNSNILPNAIGSAAACVGKGSCYFEMPMGKCGSYSQTKTTHGYNLMITNSCSHDVIYRFHTAIGPNFYPNSGDDFTALLRPGQSTKGFRTYDNSPQVRINANYTCQVKSDVEKIVRMKLSSCGPENNVTKRATCHCVTEPNAGGSAK